MDAKPIPNWFVLSHDLIFTLISKSKCLSTIIVSTYLLISVQSDILCSSWCGSDACVRSCKSH